ncbi:MAG TPA: hypothetical protein VFA80_15110 [Xanthobacteraceae bacterium]|nr:hypothetical protein [Xanthobacteraceae bacterium]
MSDHHVFHGEQRLTYLPEKNRAWQPEVDHFRKFGETRAQTEERDRALARRDFESKAIEGLDGEPPADICDVSGLPSARAQHTRYVAWCGKFRDELHDLEAKKAKLEAMIAAPSEAERGVHHGILKTVDALMGRGESGGEADAKVLADRLAIATHQAKAAEIALVEIAELIDVATLKIRHLEGRENDFLWPALAEVAGEAGLGDDYVRAIDNLREIASLMFGLAELAPYGSGFSRPQEPIKFPRMGQDGDTTISNRGAVDIWQRLADALRRNPRQNLAALIKPPAPAGGYSCWPWKGEGAQ